MTPILAFDIETVPDADGLRRVYGLPAAMSDDDVAQFAFQRRRQASGEPALGKQAARSRRPTADQDGNGGNRRFARCDAGAGRSGNP